MKLKFIYSLSVFFIFSSCETKKKNTNSESNEAVLQVSDTIKPNLSKQDKKNTDEALDTLKSKSLSRQDQVLKPLEYKLIGKIYQNPSEIEEFENYYCPGGASVGGNFNGKEYSIKDIHVKEGVPIYIIFNQSFLSDSGTVFKIVDILDITKEELLKDDDKNMYYHFCYKNGKQDEEIIAIAQYNEYAEFLTKIYKAWRADRKTEKIIEIPTDGITVENMDYGL